jgi:hypothetical protein
MSNGTHPDKTSRVAVSIESCPAGEPRSRPVTALATSIALSNETGLYSRGSSVRR